METCHTGINAGMACVMDTHRCLVTVADTELTLRPEADLANGPPHPTGNCHPKEYRDWGVDFLNILKQEAGVGELPQQGFAGPQLRRIFSNWPTVRARLEPLFDKMRHFEHPPAEGPDTRTAHEKFLGRIPSALEEMWTSPNEHRHVCMIAIGVLCGHQPKLHQHAYKCWATYHSALGTCVQIAGSIRWQQHLARGRC